MLTSNQILELNNLIDQKIITFVASNISKDLLTEVERKTLKESGIDVSKIRPEETLIYQAFSLGIASGVIPKGVLNETNYKNFKNYIQSGKFIPLNSYEKGVVKSLEKQSYSDIKGIGQKYKRLVESSVNIAERQYYEDTLKRKISEGIAKKDSLRNISNKIARELDSFGRDFDRIVQTVSHQAFDEGRQAFFVRNYGEDAQFYYHVYEGACKYCIADYLTNGLGSQPKIFKIGELPPPQANYNKKKEERIITAAPSHPHCRCTSHALPEGYIWDEEKKDFVAPKNFERKVERKSKVKIQFGDKEYSI